MGDEAVSKERAAVFQQLADSIELNKLLKKREEELLLTLTDRNRKCCQLEAELRERSKHSDGT